ncbi:HNH endonuclease signature motif containing protein [Agromyces silvae]|uniref:HNH endonuclease signature motif containing protein n=1 Tax=Agromyces silvae TaxID=3388266 RepID=UPI00280B7187|nr:DUF222 domain-containing protein [Agromyces protaetiae]
MQSAIETQPATALEWELAAISAFDGMIRQIQADQYRRIQRARELADELDGVSPASTSRERDMSTRSFVAELATTLGQHEASASRLVTEAHRLTGPRTATLDALEAGTLGLAQVRSVLELTQDLPVEVADAVERVAVEAGAAAVQRGVVSTNAEVRRRMRRLRERLHPEPLTVRRARAAEERRVCVDPAPDGMAWLSLFVEAERAVAIQARVGAIAARDRSSDPRTVAQRAADIAAELLLGGVLPDDERTRDGAGATGAVQPRISVTVPALTLLGLDDEPAELEGYGPIDAETARRLAGHAPSLRRILVHPESGAALSYGRESYRAPADLAGFVRVRDGQCRFPGCTRRAERADLDHTVAWERGGRTDASNLAALCRHHHRVKHESGWRVEHEPGGIMRWTSPAGHVLRTLPERPFVPIGPPPSTDESDGVGPPNSAAKARSSSIPPDPSDTLEEEWRSLINSHGPPAPF